MTKEKTAETLDADNIGRYVSALEEKSRELRELKEWAVNPLQFYAVKMEIPEVAKLHNVDPRTVRGYVQRGVIETHPDSTDYRTYIRASVALSLDFKKLRRG